MITRHSIVQRDRQMPKDNPFEALSQVLSQANVVPNLLSLFLFLQLFVSVWVCAHTYVVCMESRGQLQEVGALFLLFVPGFKITCSAWQQVLLPPEHLSALIFIMTALIEENYSQSEDSTSHVEEGLSLGSCQMSDTVWGGRGGWATD